MPVIRQIRDFEDPELDVYARMTENQLLRRDAPEEGLFIAESSNVVLRALEGGYRPVSLLLEEKDLSGEASKVLEYCERWADLPVFTAGTEVLRELTGFPMTRGVLCALRRSPLPDFREICRNAGRIVVLEEIMNPTNVGAIFRSAAALSMDGILLTHGCSNPLYRRASRVSMGTVFQIPWTFLEDGFWPEGGTEALKNMGFRTAAMALSDRSVGIDDPALLSEKKLAIVLGTEGYGLSEETLRACDYTVKIPMSHGVDSLNVAAASAVAFWELGKGPGK